MKCKNCGTEFYEGVFCPECGTKYEQGVNDIADSTDDSKVMNVQYSSAPSGISNGDSGHVKWYYQMWFISLLLWTSGITVGIGFIAAIVLFHRRIVKYPDNRKMAWLSFGIQMGIVGIIAVMSLL